MGEDKSSVPATRHVVVVVGLLAVIVGAALVARWLLVPEGFGQFGHYRGGAVGELMAEPLPLHQGREKCAECHDDVAGVHAKDVHGKVQCEDCHGPGATHVAELTEDKTMRSDGPPIRKPDGAEDCLTCHRRLLARPASFPQIDRVEHYRMLHVAKGDTPCAGCHSPHEPLFVDGRVDDARLHPVMNECVDCHKHVQDPSLPRPAGHPVVFECGYCHAATVADHAKRAHAPFRCGVCHQFYPVSDRAGRILKHRDPRFCLLCHAATDFKDGGAPPAISWPQHREDMAGAEGKDKVCVDCHREAFHLAAATQQGGSR